MSFHASAARAVSQIGRMMAVLRRLNDVPRRTAVLAAPRLTVLLQAQFAAGVDPYGKAWAPLKPSTLARHGPPPLTDKGTLRDGTFAKAKPQKGIEVHVGAPYGYFHQVGFVTGRTKVPPRRIVPQYGLPAPWAAVLQLSAREAAQQLVGSA